MEVSYIIYNIPAICFGHSSGHPQEGASQRMDMSRYYKVFEPMYRRRILK